MPSVHSSSRTLWNPLLDGSQARIARETILAIAEAVRGEFDNILQKCKEPPDNYAPAFELGEGAAGMAVFFAYLHLAGLLANARETAFGFLDAAIETMSSRVMTPSLFSGFTGVGWAARHVMDLLGEPSSDLTEELDLALEQYVGHTPWKDDYDLISGLVGFGVYCLEQRDSEPARRALTLIVERLHELAEQSEDEVRWFTPPELLVEMQRKDYPQGYYNLGLAHGIPGVIALLSRTAEAGVAAEKSTRMLKGSVEWLLKQRMNGTNSSFSGFLVPESGVHGNKSDDCRLAWCYGDGGAAAALMQAARRTGTPSWEHEALAIARKAAQRDREVCGVRDVCFCHGAAGLLQVFNRFYQATGEEVFADAARRWLDATLEYRKPGTGVAGYQVYSANNSMEVELMSRFGVIEGAAGVGLSLLAAIGDIEPNWDRIFQVDIPPHPLSNHR